jgi:hypothetical protein
MEPDCLDCEHMVSITRDHRDEYACGLMKPLHDYAVDWANSDCAPWWCPKRVGRA